MYPGDYLRSQYDPARDRTVLLPANAMIASEGTVASVLFWTSAGLAGNAGATPGGGLLQPGLLDAERDRQPFSSVADFEQRVGRAIGTLGLAVVEMEGAK